jgi:hypothetical protein
MTTDYDDGGIPRDVLLYVRHCASTWEAGARLLGNARADDIVRACDAAIEALATVEQIQHGITALEDGTVWGNIMNAIGAEGATPLADEIARLIRGLPPDDARRADLECLVTTIADLEQHARQG